MRTNGYIYPDSELYDYVMAEFTAKGVTKENIGQIVYDLEVFPTYVGVKRPSKKVTSALL